MVSGCFDKFVRVWNIKQKRVIDWQQTTHYITTLKFTPEGDKLFVGLVNGDVIIYDSTANSEKLTLIKVVVCKNKRGKNHTGRKVTGIEFLGGNIAMVTTNDSRIRFIDGRNGK